MANLTMNILQYVFPCDTVWSFNGSEIVGYSVGKNLHFVIEDGMAVFNVNAQCCDIMNPLIKEETMEEQIRIDIPKGYEFVGVDDNAQQVVFEKIKPQYPKTYEECCDVLVNNDRYREILVSIPGVSYKSNLIEDFTKLIICRDAYWKLAGDWEPDWKDGNTKYIITFAQNEVYKDVSIIFNYILAFPTEEMRDAFYENFKELINETKELL